MQNHVTFIAIIICLSAQYNTFLGCNYMPPKYLALCNECSKQPNFLNGDIEKHKKECFSTVYSSSTSCESHARKYHPEINISCEQLQANSCVLKITSKQDFKKRFQQRIKNELDKGILLPTIIDALNNEINDDNPDAIKSFNASAAQTSEEKSDVVSLNNQSSGACNNNNQFIDPVKTAWLIDQNGRPSSFFIGFISHAPYTPMYIFDTKTRSYGGNFYIKKDNNPWKILCPHCDNESIHPYVFAIHLDEKHRPS